MDAINIADLKDELGALIDRLEAGESVDIVRDGRVFARVTPEAPVKTLRAVDVEMLREATKDLPFDSQDTVAEMRRMARY